MEEGKSECDIREMLEMQVSEVEMLTSMFPGSGEFVLDDPLSIAEVEAYINGEIQYDNLSSRIGFSLHQMCHGVSIYYFVRQVAINVDCQCILHTFKDTCMPAMFQHGIEMVCRLPHEYPSVPPVVFLRIPSLSRAQQKELGEDLQAMVKSMDSDQLYIGSIIEWVQENANTYLSGKTTDSNVKEETNKKTVSSFSRLWIYSHHIYSKIKRKDILEFSDELNLTGFCMPGKPGMVVVEGASDNVEEFWQRLRSMQWKHLTMKEKEDIPVDGQEALNSLRKFPNFKEMNFDARAGKGRGIHMDLGLLCQFLQERGFGHIFKMYFGVDGKVSEDGQ